MIKYISRTAKKVHKIYKWVKFLWNDFDFDHSYLLKVIKFKLEMMEPVIRDGYALDADKTADEIKGAILCLNLLIEDDFSRHHDELDKKYGEYQFIYLENGNTTFERPGVTEENKEEYKSEFRAALEADDIDKKLVQKRFFTLLKKYENWWD